VTAISNDDAIRVKLDECGGQQDCRMRQLSDPLIRVCERDP